VVLTTHPLRFAILHHTGYGPAHYDLLLERSPRSPLVAFRLPVWPITHRTRITPLKDHRREYLEYEGPVSGDRGQVRRVAEGTCAHTAVDERQTRMALSTSAGNTTFVLELVGPRCFIRPVDAAAPSSKLGA
jgi:hypothetical protein